MNSERWVSLIALTGWLILALSALGARQIGARKGVVMGFAWQAIFLVTLGVFVAMGR